MYGIYTSEIHVSNNNSGVRNIMRVEEPPVGLENLFKILLGLIKKECVPVEQGRM